MERRYLIVPGIRSSRIHIIDTKPDPRAPKLEKVIEPAELIARAGYTSPHTIHCGPEGIYVSALGSANGEGPGGIFMMDPESFDILGAGNWIGGRSTCTMTSGGTWGMTR
jgi:selenium-binding protein 1